MNKVQQLPAKEIEGYLRVSKKFVPRGKVDCVAFCCNDPFIFRKKHIKKCYIMVNRMRTDPVSQTIVVLKFGGTYEMRKVVKTDGGWWLSLMSGKHPPIIFSTEDFNNSCVGRVHQIFDMTHIYK